MRASERDVIIIGGGPAGSVAAAALARGGKDVLLLERETFPRFHVGESMLPESFPILEKIGVGDALDAAGFPVKRGATFILEDGSARTRICFADALGDAGRAKQVLRSQFDEILLRHAEASGAEVREGTSAQQFEEHSSGVTVDGIGARDLVDASGRRGFLAKRLGLREMRANLRKVTVHAQYGSPITFNGVPDGDIIIVSRLDEGWIWVIPLPGGRTSVGAVFDRSRHPDHGDAAETLRAQIDSSPVLKTAMAGLEPDTGVRFESDFAYEASRYVGDHWFLAGDAGAFLDPAFSTGVHLAIVSGWFAAQAILDGSTGARRRYEKSLRRRVRVYDKFATGFYDLDFRDMLFTPKPPPAVLRAVTAVLAGAPPITLRDRFRVGLFHALTRLQRRLPLAQRLHRPEKPAS